MTSLSILIDFGSTFTKVTALDLSAARVVGIAQAPTTVQTDVQEGLLRALALLEEQHALFHRIPSDLEILYGKVVFVSSSAAGGLRMAVVGLVPGLTVEAANLAALGAGAKVVGSFSFKLSEKRIAEMEALRPDMILLTGGTDGGDSQTLLHNANMLAHSALNVPVIAAGNKAVADQVCQILAQVGKEVKCVENVMPRPNTISVEAAREEIRRLFMDKIIQAKGLEKIQALVPMVLPTPMAVLRGAVVSSQGTGQFEGWGDLMVLDVGGATTDVHSVCWEKCADRGIIPKGLPEPLAKRTVEGDLGIRYNACNILSRVGPDNLYGDFSKVFPELAVPLEDFTGYIKEVSSETSRVPQKNWHYAVDAILARVAIELAIERHVGRLERIYSKEGEIWLQYGKDLRETPTVICTGGIFIHNPFVDRILSQNDSGDGRYRVLRPKNPRIFIDQSYLLYAIGLLAENYPDVAAKLFKEQIAGVEVAKCGDGERIETVT